MGTLVLMALFAPTSTESAIANGDTRTLYLTNSNTKETGEFTYMAYGTYDKAALEKLNWFLRDWRLNEETQMDPKLFDIIWEVYRESGSKQPLDVLSGYRSPQTNAMLRRRSRQVAEHSQHMLGKAIDAHFVDVTTATIRDIAMRMQAGGVGFYPSGMTPWVHIDSGPVRYWPRMSRDALARLFPDGKTVFIPADGHPMPGYEVAKAEIESRGGDVVAQTQTSFFGALAALFGGPRGGGADDAEESSDAQVVVASAAGRGRAGAPAAVVEANFEPPSRETVASAAGRGRAGAPAGIVEAKLEAASGETVVSAAGRGRAGLPAAVVEAKLEAPSGETVADAAPARDGASADPGSPVTLRDAIAARFIAPLPPRKPLELLALALSDAPLPPPRPAEFAVAAAGSASPQQETTFAVASASSQRVAAPAPNRDLIRALLQRGRFPGVITHGFKEPPHEALALTETVESTESADDLARAAKLEAPPPRSPELRSSLDAATDTTIRARSRSAKPHHGFSPYGELTTDAFRSPPAAADTAQKLRALASAN